MGFPLGSVHFFYHRTHHGPPRILGKLGAMVPDPPPVESVPNRGPFTLGMVAHFPDV